MNIWNGPVTKALNVKFLFCLLWWSVSGFAQTASVDMDLFQVGRNWRWLYSQWNKTTHEWEPYFVERYTVIERQDPFITLHMTSGAYYGTQSSAHHKFIVDFRKCERAKNDPRFKNFTVELYTKSFGPQWELVSHAHPNLIFVEKFNCTSAFPRQKVLHASHGLNDGKSYSTFYIQTQPPKPSSWYFLDHSLLKGVAASKMFGPNQQYKMELLE